MTLSEAINAAQSSANRHSEDYVVFNWSGRWDFVPRDAAYSLLPNDFIVHPVPDHLRKSA